MILITAVYRGESVRFPTDKDELERYQNYLRSSGWTIHDIFVDEDVKFSQKEKDISQQMHWQFLTCK